MNLKEFKKVLASILLDYGFATKNNISKAETDELIIIISTQKSNYDNNYYLNYGFLIKELSPELTTPMDYQCDIFGRLSLIFEGKILTSINFENLSSEEFSYALKISLNERIKPVLEYGLLKYFDLYPTAVSTVRMTARKYLGL